MPKSKAKPEWSNEIDQAREALEKLIDLQLGYQDQLEELSEDEKDSPLAEKFQAILDVNIESAIDMLEELKAAMEMPEK